MSAHLPLPARILVTGAAGFIGGALCRALVARDDIEVLALDLLGYAANLDGLKGLANTGRLRFVQGDIGDRALLDELLALFVPGAVIHLAAQTHVDRSIDSPEPFILNNLLGTATLLDATRCAWQAQPDAARAAFRFLHISTDEVFGNIAQGAAEAGVTAYAPNSPYAASKAGADHLVRAYHHTFGLPVLVSHCPNNYGPWQFPEKLIPLMILKALRGEALPVYGDGQQVREWLHVEDHVAALQVFLAHGVPGAVVGIGSGQACGNLDLVGQLAELLEARLGRPVKNSIQFVPDRPGHDRRYALCGAAFQATYGWQPALSLPEGLARTVDWYLGNADWLQQIQQSRYSGQRLGLLTGGITS